MRIRIKSHAVLDETMLVSGYIGKDINSFNDLEIKVKELVDFIRFNVPSYFLKLCSVEAMEMETDIFDQERLLDEIDYGILSKYIKEANLLNA